MNFALISPCPSIQERLRKQLSQKYRGETRTDGKSQPQLLQPVSKKGAIQDSNLSAQHRGDPESDATCGLSALGTHQKVPRRAQERSSAWSIAVLEVAFSPSAPKNPHFSILGWLRNNTDNAKSSKASNSKPCLPGAAWRPEQQQQRTWVGRASRRPWSPASQFQVLPQAHRA